jgi:hypothetical protein
LKKSGTSHSPEEVSKKNDSESHATPRWVKVFGIILISFVLLALILMLFSGGKHGPGRHLKFHDAKGNVNPIILKIAQLL